MESMVEEPDRMVLEHLDTALEEAEDRETAFHIRQALQHLGRCEEEEDGSN